MANRSRPLEVITEVWRSAYSNLYDVYFSTAAWDTLCFRAEAVTIGATALTGEYLESLKRTVISGYSPVKEITITFREDQGYSVLKKLQEQFDIAFDRETRRMRVPAAAISSPPEAPAQAQAAAASKVGPAAAKIDMTIVLQVPSVDGFTAAANINIAGALIQEIPTPQLSWKDSTSIVYETKFWIDNIDYQVSGKKEGFDSTDTTVKYSTATAGLKAFKKIEMPETEGTAPGSPPSSLMA